MELPCVIVCVYGSHVRAPLAVVRSGGSRGGPPHRRSEPLVVAGRAYGVHLSQEEIHRLRFRPTVGTIRLSEGTEVSFNCSIVYRAFGHELSILWFKDGREIPDGTQAAVPNQDTVTLLSTISIKSVRRVDAGEYRCRLSVSNKLIESNPIIVEVEGPPTFTKEPSDLNVTRNASFTLTCEAVGPPNPVTIKWLHKGQRIDHSEHSPSSITIPGIQLIGRRCGELKLLKCQKQLCFVVRGLGICPEWNVQAAGLKVFRDPVRDVELEFLFSSLGWEFSVPP
ncbi:hypothetical protein NFI96_003375 [Prochilodus magdalenae]|nr:hypothetical protein NFI96_003375 [Prochilodus magdalenae]